MVLCLLSQSAFAVDLDSLVGRWRLDPPAEDPIKPAIDRGVAKMNFLIRGLARSRLQQRNPQFPAIEIRREGETVRIRVEKFADLAHPVNGDAVRWKSPDGELTVKLANEDKALMVRYENKDGRREQRYSREGDLLLLQVQIASRYFGEPVRYALRYRKE